MPRHNRLFRFLLASAGLGIILPWQASAVVVHVRGTVESLQGQGLQVTSRDGQETKVDLAPNWSVTEVAPVPISAIRKGDYVGISARGPESHMVALEVHIFPDSMKGVGEGHRPWDLAPESTMTNGTIDAEVSQANGRMLTVSYKGGQATVEVPPSAAVVTFEAGNRAEIKPGAKVFIIGPETDGVVTSSRVSVGKDGMTPPM